MGGPARSTCNFNTDSTESFGQRLRQLRELRGLNPASLAERSGLSRGTIWDLEEDQRGAYASTVCKLAQALQVDTDILLGRKRMALPLSPLTDEEEHLLLHLRHLTWRQRDLVLDFVHHLRRQREAEAS